MMLLSRVFSTRSRNLLVACLAIAVTAGIGAGCGTNELAAYHERITVLQPIVQLPERPVIATDMSELAGQTGPDGGNAAFLTRWQEAASLDHLQDALTASLTREFRDFVPNTQIVRKDTPTGDLNGLLTIVLERVELAAKQPDQPASIHFVLSMRLKYLPENKVVWEWEGEYTYLIREHWQLYEMEPGAVTLASVSRLAQEDFNELVAAVIAEEGLGFDLTKQFLHDRDHPEE